MQLLKRLTLQVLICASVSLLAACATTMAIDALERRVVCKLWNPTYWRDAWPDDAIEQAKDNNTRRDSVCASLEKKANVK